MRCLQEVQELDYDRVGNRTFHRDVSGQALVYSVDAADQLSQIDLEGGATRARFLYDPAGRLTHYQNGDGSAVHEAYGYDALGRLSTYVEPGSAYVMQLAYDAQGRRRQRTDSAGAEDFFFAGGLERRSATRIRRVSPGGLDAAVAEIQEGAVVSLYRDGTGTVTAAVTSTAIAQRTYTAFGTERSASGSAPIDRGFASLVREGQTQLHYARARHYDPRWGRSPLLDYSSPCRVFVVRPGPSQARFASYPWSFRSPPSIGRSRSQTRVVGCRGGPGLGEGSASSRGAGGG